MYINTYINCANSMDYTSLSTETTHRKEHEIVWRPVPKTFGTGKEVRIELNKKIKYYRNTKCSQESR